MSNVNLATEKIPQNKAKKIGKGLIISIVSLVLVICLYVVLLFMNKKVSAQIVAVQSQFKSEYNKFLASNANEVFDFKKRSNLAKKLISADRSQRSIFNQLEKDLLPQVYLNSYSYNKNKNNLSLNCSGDNFNVVAKQVLSFKKSNYFQKVSLRKSELSIENNRVEFIINLKLK